MNDTIQSILVVLFSILLATAGVGHVLATPSVDSTQSSADFDDQNDTYEIVSGSEEERTALELKYSAINTLTTLDPADRSDETRKRQAAERVNETLGSYLDGDRVESPAVFEGDAAAVSRMATLADADPQRTNETTWLLAKANARTANASITDANRALERFGDEIDDPGHRNAIESHLRNAERAYERGQASLESEDTVEQTVRDRSRAIRQFMTAWRQSQQALDTIQRETTPNVTITTRSDPVRNGSEPVNRSISGTIEAVRPAELGNVTVSVDGGHSIEVQPNSSTVPASSVTFTANVTVENREERILTERVR